VLPELVGAELSVIGQENAVVLSVHLKGDVGHGGNVIVAGKGDRLLDLVQETLAEGLTVLGLRGFHHGLKGTHKGVVLFLPILQDFPQGVGCYGSDVGVHFGLSFVASIPVNTNNLAP